MENQELIRHSHGGWAVTMEKVLCWIAMGVSGLMLILFLVDLIVGFPFGRTSAAVDVLGVLACGIVGYLSWDAFRDLK